MSILLAVLTTCVACTDRDSDASDETAPAAEFSRVGAGTGQVLVVDDAAIADESLVSEWLAYGRTHHERRFSPLTDVNVANVSDLKVDWFLDLPRDVGLVSTPLVVDGVMYFTGTMNVIRAVDASTGRLKWEFDPKVGEALANKRQVGFVHNRGIAFYEGKVFTATFDGRLIAIDAGTGEAIWTTRTFPADSALYITGAPKAFKGKVLIGNGGTEAGPTRGFVTAYDAETGEEAWKFYIVPGNPADGFENEAMKMAAETWTGEWWNHGGGGNAWHGFTYDPDLDVVYIGTGNGSPWNRRIRSPEGGDNLFLCSIVALDPDTGEYRWHYQTTPGETWDYNSNMDIVLADLTIDGEDVKALLHAPKNGFFYVIDRQTGELISAEPFADVNWATHVDPQTGRPVEVEGARYESGTALIAPGPWGAHSWHAMSFNPDTGLAYIPTLHMALGFNDQGIDFESFQSVAFRGGIGLELSWPDDQPREYPASLVAWDPVKQEKVWEIPQDHFWSAGTLTTAGNLVFQGRADGQLLAYDAGSGEILWTFDAGLGISAPPITYQLDGKQYISLLVGFGGGYSALGGQGAASLGWSYRRQTRRLITFSLEGDANLPAQPPPLVPQPIAAPDFVADEVLATEGSLLFERKEIEGLCWYCHGMGAIAGGAAPDLRASPAVLDTEAFDSIVRGGLLTANGMPAFSDLTDREVDSLRHYVRQQAEAALPESTADPRDRRTQASREAIQEFAQSLKGELQSAMQSGGPVEAMDACKVKAPQIAAGISAQKGWRVGRTSLKTRNPGNAPDAWERGVLEQFEARKAAGEAPELIDYAEIVDDQGNRQFRYMKAIPTQEICLTCHGTQIAAPVVDKIDNLYPEDQARGFETGDLRGAFTVTQPM
ncbi:MAG: PQQ-dependent dehydrogenase, methanol/ethanol family [Gammaproteobacteria bacterium]